MTCKQCGWMGKKDELLLMAARTKEGKVEEPVRWILVCPECKTVAEEKK